MSAQHTPGPWTTTPGRFWICSVGNNPDDPGVWSAYPVAANQSFPFGSKKADARLIAEAPAMLEAMRLVIGMADGDNAPLDEFGDEICPFERCRAILARIEGAEA